MHLSGTPSVLEICASNPIGEQAQVGGSGLGLLGTQERVSLLGGLFNHGRDERHDFRLAVTLPLTGERA